jgi:hypothetical protein
MGASYDARVADGRVLDRLERHEFWHAYWVGLSEDQQVFIRHAIQSEIDLELEKDQEQGL